MRELVELRTGLGREVCVVGRASAGVELHATGLTVRVEELPEERRTPDANPAPREDRGDPREPILLADPVLVPCEANRPERCDRHQDHCQPERTPHLGVHRLEYQMF
jgi:hypothetical protein